MLIAIVGVGSTTALSVLERTRESGLLRAIGLSRKELGRLATVEAGLCGTIGAVLGLAIGVPYAWLAIISLGVEWAVAGAGLLRRRGGARPGRTHGRCRAAACPSRGASEPGGGASLDPVRCAGYQTGYPNCIGR
ncbi:FtsX-like permease family protein [Lentzea aerocolonigenes]|uniref:FtsX-like permease family protein n=1 Tax=Lentzea aerocolonigenes TaxID=68170 RepID=UPI000A790F8A|nr:ABC transporter permease [Lentzea aerocolonigenes]